MAKSVYRHMSMHVKSTYIHKAFHQTPQNLLLIEGEGHGLQVKLLTYFWKDAEWQELEKKENESYFDDASRICSCT